jgi:tetratricopeptide (TPR) repeat protein
MKKKCIICDQIKGKRICSQYNKTMICPRCCAQLRNASCGSCSYYKTAEKYAEQKFQKSRGKSFIIEINEEIEEAVDKALVLIERNKLKKAASRLTELLSRYPDYYMVQYGMGVLYAVKDQVEKAIPHLEKAVDIFPYFTEAYFNLGVAYKQAFDFSNMTRCLEKVIRLSDADTDYYQQAKNLLEGMENIIKEQHGVDMGNYIKAQEQFQLGVDLMERREWQKAIHAFNAAERIVKPISQVYGNIGICQAQLGRKSDALSAFDKALELDPQYELAIVNKAMTETLAEGEKLDSSVKTVEYYKDFPMQNRSFIQYVLDGGMQQALDENRNMISANGRS